MFVAVLLFGVFFFHFLKSHSVGEPIEPIAVFIIWTHFRSLTCFCIKFPNRKITRGSVNPYSPLELKNLPVPFVVSLPQALRVMWFILPLKCRRFC